MVSNKNFWNVSRNAVLIVLGALFFGLLLSGINDSFLSGLSGDYKVVIGVVGLLVLGLFFGIGLFKQLRRGGK